MKCIEAAPIKEMIVRRTNSRASHSHSFLREPSAILQLASAIMTQVFSNPLVFLRRVRRRVVPYADGHPDDVYEEGRIDERTCFGLDIGSGANKLLPLGCDVRRVTDVQCSMTHLPFRERSFVIALFRHSLEHTKHWVQALNEAKRVALEIYVILPHEETWHLDIHHVEPFNLEESLMKDFELGSCLKIGE